MKNHKLLIPALCVGLLAACSSTRYGDPDKEETLTIDWGSTDLQTFADYMTKSLIESPALAYIDRGNGEADNRIRVAFGGIANETREHVNTDMVSRRIQSSLLETGKFRFMARKESQGQDEIADEVRFQQGSGRVDPNLAIAFGSQLNADVVLYGNLADIYKEKGRSIESLGAKRKDLYYQFYMAAVDVKTGEILWAKEEDIRKEETVSLFGRG